MPPETDMSAHLAVPPGQPQHAAQEPAVSEGDTSTSMAAPSAPTPGQLDRGPQQTAAPEGTIGGQREGTPIAQPGSRAEGVSEPGEDSDDDNADGNDDIINVHVTRKSKTRAERKLRKGKKAGNPGRFREDIREFLLTFQDAYVIIDKKGDGSRKRLSDFWHMVRCAMWAKYKVDDLRVGMTGNGEGLQPIEVVTSANDAIKSFFRYRERKGTSSAANPWKSVLMELRTPDKAMPHQTTVWRVWMRENVAVVNQEYDRREPLSSKTGIALRSECAKTLFEALPVAEQQLWKDKANVAYLEECEKYKERLSGDPSSDPEEQAEARQRLSHVVTPVLKLIAEYTGFTAITLMGGAPPPQAVTVGGDYLLGAVHYGKTTEGRDFTEWDPDGFRKNVLHHFYRFLKKTERPGEAVAGALQAATDTGDMIIGDIQPAGLDVPGEGTAAIGEISQGPAPASTAGAAAAAPAGKGKRRRGRKAKAMEDTTTPVVLRDDATGHMRDVLEGLSEKEQRRQIIEWNGLTELDFERACNILRNNALMEQLGLPVGNEGGAVAALRSNPPPADGSSSEPEADQSEARAAKQMPDGGASNDAPVVHSPPALEPTADPSDNAGNGVLIGTTPDNAATDITTLDEPQLPAAAATSSTSVSTVLPVSLLLSQPTPPPRSDADRSTGNADAVAPESHLGAGPSQSSTIDSDRPSAPPPARDDAVSQQDKTLDVDLSTVADSVDKTGWPAWVTTQYTRLMLEQLPLREKGVWLTLLSTWVEIEKAQGFSNKGRLQTKCRPPEIHLWIKNARNRRISINKPDAYRANFLAWWDLLNEGRERRDGLLVRDGNKDWTDLLVPGINGLLNVVIGLLGYHDIATPEAWARAAADISWAFTQVLDALRNGATSNHTGGSQKRGCPESSDDEDESSRASRPAPRGPRPAPRRVSRRQDS